MTKIRPSEVERLYVVEMAPDPVAAVRMTPVVDPDRIPAVPKGFKPLPATAKKPLYKVADEHHAELRAALGELAARKAELKEDFGRYAPDGEAAATVLRRMERIQAGKAAVRALLTYFEEQDDVVLHDAMAIVLKGQKELVHAATEDPSVLGRYPALVALSEQRSAAISEGIARSRAEKRSAAGEETAGSDGP